MTDTTVRRLRELSDEYTALVNSAVAEDRDDLVRELADQYPDAIAAVLAEAA
jgi:hypothetical protein